MATTLLAALAACLFIGAASLWMRRADARLDGIRGQLAVIAARVEPTALELAARKARRDSRRARDAARQVAS